MKKAASIFLRAQITHRDIHTMIGWMENEAVTRYLSDGRDTAEWLRDLYQNVPEHLLTMNLNEGGEFYLIDSPTTEHDDRLPVGFIRLGNYDSRKYELVFAVGREELWGQGLGSAAVREALGVAFFDLRAESLRARVRRENIRSGHLLSGCGFTAEPCGERHIEYTLNFRQYIGTLNKKLTQKLS